MSMRGNNGRSINGHGMVVAGGSTGLLVLTMRTIFVVVDGHAIRTEPTFALSSRFLALRKCLFVYAGRLGLLVAMIATIGRHIAFVRSGLGRITLTMVAPATGCAECLVVSHFQGRLSFTALHKLRDGIHGGRVKAHGGVRQKVVLPLVGERGKIDRDEVVIGELGSNALTILNGIVEPEENEPPCRDLASMRLADEIETCQLALTVHGRSKIGYKLR